MNNKYVRKDPLLFITQPSTINPPKVNMQQVFSIKKTDEIKKTEESNEQNKQEKQKTNAMSRNGTTIATESKKPRKNKIHYLEDEDEVGVFGTPLKKSKNEETEEKAQEQEDKSEEKTTMSKSSSFFKRVKSFREMNTLERLDYLVHFPKQLPPVPCLFQTKDRDVRGYLKGRTDDEIEVRLYNNTVTTLSVNDIESVRIIGMY